MTTFSPFGVGNTRCRGRTQHVAQRSGVHAGLVEYVLVDLVVTGERRYASSPLAPAEVRPAFSTTIGFFFETRLATSASTAVLQVLIVLRDDLGVVVLLEERQQIVLVDIGLVAEADVRRGHHLGRPRSR